MTEGLVLQDAGIWKKFLEKEIIPRNHAAELYFEEPDIEGFVKKLEKYPEPIEYVNRLMEHSWGQRVVRFYDPDGNLIEVGTPMGEAAQSDHKMILWADKTEAFVCLNGLAAWDFT